MSFFAAFGKPSDQPIKQKVIRRVQGGDPGPHRDIKRNLSPLQTPPPKKRSPRRELKQKTVKLVAHEPRNGYKRSPSYPVFGDDSEGDTDHDSAFSHTQKRVRVENGSRIDQKRRVRDFENWSEEDNATFRMKHGADLIESGKPGDFRRLFKDGAERSEDLLLRYPSASQAERFQLVAPKEWDGYKPAEDISETVKCVLRFYLPSTMNQALLDESKGIPFRLTRAINRQNQLDYRAAILEFNSIIHKARSDGTITTVLDETKTIPLFLVERILNQTYVRTVSPQVEKLRSYAAFSDKTYGEILPPFSSQIFRDTGLDSSSVFFDMGSGVGNVVLQAALETGCESHGIEVMANPCDLARAQAEEFPARCRLWGLKAGSVSLQQGDFLKDSRISRILQRADVVLINNQAFNPSLNDTLTSLFLDMKEGARIVSLRSFVPAGWRLVERNRDSIIGVLEVTRKEYWSGCVSWKPEGGEYFVSTKDSSRIEKILAGGKIRGRANP